VQAAPTPVPVANEGLDRTLVAGVAWTGLFKWSSQALSWLSTILVARLLTPHDYGIVAMSRVYVDLAQLINEGGFGVTVVQHQDLGRHALARLAGLAAALGLAMGVVSVALAKPAAMFFGEPAVAAVIVVLSLGLVLEGLENIGRGFLARQLRFKELGAIEALQMALNVAITLGLAFWGAGYWALVVGTIGSTAGGALFVLLRTRLWPRWPGPLRDLMLPIKFGAKVLTSNVVWWLYRSADITVIGRWLGGTAAGLYSFSYSIAAVPTDRIGQVLGRVASPILAASQKDLPALRRYVLRITEGVSLVTFPLLAGLALVADNLVRLVLGDKWVPAVPALKILAVAGIIRAVMPLMNQLLLALHEAATVLRSTCVLAIAMPVLFVLGTNWGVSGVASVWLLGYPVIGGFLLLRPALKKVGLHPGHYAQALAPAAVSALVMSGVVTAVSWVPLQSLVLRLAGQIAAGAAAYILCLLALWPDRVRTYAELLRGLLRR
jgi:PST family polysaccharide transporter